MEFKTSEGRKEIEASRQGLTFSNEGLIAHMGNEDLQEDVQEDVNSTSFY